MPQIMQDEAGNLWNVDDAGNVLGPAGRGGQVVSLPPSPKDIRREAREDARDQRQDRIENRQTNAYERDTANQGYNNVLKLRSDFDALPTTKEYRVGIAQLATGLQTADNATGDNALIYAYAKAMDPASVVRESEMGMAASGQSVIDAAAANLKKQLGIEGGGQLDPKVRERLRREMGNKVAQLNQIYKVQRQRFIDDANAFGIDPVRVVGPHDGDAFMPVIKAYEAKHSGQQDAGEAGGAKKPDVDPEMSRQLDALINAGADEDTINAVLEKRNFGKLEPGSLARARKWMAENPGRAYYGARANRPEPQRAYEDSYLGQGMSGVNEGVASVIGGPVDLATSALNLVPKGINALAGTNIPTIQNPIGGSEFFRDKMAGWGIYTPTDDPSKQFVRRTGESVGAAAVPLGAGTTLPRFLGGLAAAAGGGAGAATAEQAFPNSPLAEFAGEAIGSGVTGAGLLKAAQRNRRRQMEAAIPTVPQLKEQAGELYRQAEARGVTAEPAQTTDLADRLRRALTDEGRVSPTGRISEVYPKAKEGMQLVDDYAGQPMNPTQMQTVRSVIADALNSPDKSERRLGSILTDTFDDWSMPLAPELPAARDVASRYLNAEKLETARDLAAARASQFSGSGFENALRTEYRALDRNVIKGKERYSKALRDEIEKVSRGTPVSNLARNVGKLAPTGVVSLGLGTGGPAAIGGLLGGPTGAAALGGGAMALGMFGRGAATRMGVRNADVAELVARNGGPLPKIDVLTPDMKRYLAAWSAAQAAKYLPVGEGR